jgi:RNA polymerase sigma factor (TIGR02999 family)
MRNLEALTGTITALLRRSQDRTLPATERQNAETLLFRHVYPLVLQKAQGAMRFERKDHTLTPAGVVSEVYIELFHKAEIEWQDRQHFFSLVSKKIRDVLVTHARKRRSRKRGGQEWANTTLTTAAAAVPPSADKTSLTLIVESVLEQLERDDPKAARISEYLFYGGFTMEETAELLSTSVSTVERIKKRVKGQIIEQCVKDDLRYGEKSPRRSPPGS